MTPYRRHAHRSAPCPQTLGWLQNLGLSGILFEAMQEPWKAETEGYVGPYWGRLGRRDARYVDVLAKGRTQWGTTWVEAHISILQLSSARFLVVCAGWCDGFNYPYACNLPVPATGGALQQLTLLSDNATAGGADSEASSAQRTETATVAAAAMVVLTAGGAVAASRV
jgi:hypothetical protein